MFALEHRKLWTQLNCLQLYILFNDCWLIRITFFHYRGIENQVWWLLVWPLPSSESYYKRAIKETRWRTFTRRTEQHHFPRSPTLRGNGSSSVWLGAFLKCRCHFVLSLLSQRARRLHPGPFLKSWNSFPEHIQCSRATTGDCTLWQKLPSY